MSSNRELGVPHGSRAVPDRRPVHARNAGTPTRPDDGPRADPGLQRARLRGQDVDLRAAGPPTVVQCRSPADATPDGHRRLMARYPASESTGVAQMRALRDDTGENAPATSTTSNAIHAAGPHWSLYGVTRSDHAAPPVPADTSTTVMDNAEYPCPRECFTIATRRRRNRIRSEFGRPAQRLLRTTTRRGNSASTCTNAATQPLTATDVHPRSPGHSPPRYAPMVNRVRC